MTAEGPVGDPENPTIRVFGGMGLIDGGEPISIGGPRQQKLLALLAVRAGAVVDIDWLTEHLWTDDDRPAAPAPALRTYVSRLRSSFPEGAQSWIETVPAGYRLAAPEGAVEHLTVEALRAAAKAARDREDPLAAQELLDEALGIWRGAPFRELEDDEWARGRIEHLEQDRLEMLEERWETALALGRHTQITGELASFTSEHGLRDRPARQFALALHRSGRTPEALRVLANHRRTVADETGLDPSPAVIALEQALVDGDASLDAESAGRPLRGYRLVEEAGVGAFAIVWRAIQPSVNREVAIKQIRSELASQPEFIRRFEAEAHLVARIEHPHIVPLIDFWRDPDSAYLVMRWLQGGTLERRLDDGPLPISETLVLAHQIGGALSAAHGHGIIHRDVKTGNILFDEAGHAFLGDFGIALEATESAGPEAALSPGSPAYSAPEQIRREPLGPEADVFSLGVVVFECLTGSLPFAAMSAHDLVERQLTEPFVPLAELRSDVPTSVSDAVAKATAKDPADRFPSVAAFLEALEPAAVVSAVDVPPFEGEVTNPYKGLQAFDDADSDRFFGRERLVSELVARFAGDTISSRCAIVVGPSGSGKSSVVRAGLVPAIRAGRVAGSDEWFITTMIPGTDPFEALEAALLRIAVNPPVSLLDQLRDGRRGILRSVRRCLGTDDDRVLLVVDQFEEVFAGSTVDDATQFLDALAAAVAEPTSPLRLLVTLRADFYDRPLAHQTFATVLKQTSVDVTPLAPDELERAIVDPARQQGVAFESGLVARIAAEATGQPAPLPLLQYALGELFDRREGNVLTSGAYDAIGGLSGALASRAEAIFSSSDPGKRVALRMLFGRMVDPLASSADLRRRISVADFDRDADATWVLGQLGQARLVTFDRDVATREPTVEVAHEALLREWPRLVDWLREDAALLRSIDELSRASATWQAGGRETSDLYRGGRLESAEGLASTAASRLRPVDIDFIAASQAAADAERSVEDGRVKRLRLLVGVVGVALVMALIAGGLAVVAQRQADDQAEAANAAAAEAENQTRLAEGEAAAAQAANERSELSTLISRSAALRGEDADVSVLLALEANRRSPSPESEQAVLNALGSNDLPNRLSNNRGLWDNGVDCSGVDSWPDGTNEFSVSAEGILISRDPLTGVITEYGTAPDPCAYWMGDLEQGFGVAVDEDALRMWIGQIGSPWEIEKEFDDPTVFMSSSLGLDGRIPIVTFGDTPSVSLLDAATGDPVGTPISGGEQLVSDVASDDGSLWAVSFGTPDPSEPDGTTVVVDAESGEERFRFSSEQPAQSMVFDMEARELVAAVFPSTLITIDLDTGGVVASVELPTTADFLDVGIRLDGLVVAVVNNEVLVVDRQSGAAVSRSELRDVLFAWYRPDGRLFTASAGDERTGVLDLEGNALVRQTYSVNPFAKTTFNAGLVSTIETPTGSTVEVIDLASGERSVTELVTVDGERFTPHSVQPDRTGLWAIDAANVFTRWEDGQLVERLELGGEGGAGTRLGDLYGYGYNDGEGDFVASLIDLGSSSADVLFTVPTEGYVQAHPTPDGGSFVLEDDGALSHYNAQGELVNEVSTTALNTGIITVDPSSGTVAAATRRGIVSIIDPATGDTETLPTLEPISNLGFGRDGELLALTGLDGTVRLWDLERNRSAGVAWSGAGSVGGSPSWFDADSNSIWVASSGKVLNIPLDPVQWIEQACDVVGRDLTQDEWDRYVPGDETRQSACGRDIVDEPAGTGDVAEAAAESVFAIETMFDLESEPGLGTFEVSLGADAMGCSAGSVLENGGTGGITNEFACEGGQREGTFTIEWQIVDDVAGPGDANGPWTVIETSGDFAGLSGEGIWSGTGDDVAAYGSFPGVISFDS